MCAVLREIRRYGFLAEHMFSRAHIATTSLSVAYDYTLHLHHNNSSATTISGLCVCVMLYVALFLFRVNAREYIREVTTRHSC